MASPQSCGCSPREKDSLQSVAREHNNYFLCSDLNQFRRDAIVPSRLPEIKCVKEFSDLLQGGDDFLQFASDDARHAYLWYGLSFVGPVTHFWLSEMKKRL